MHTLTRPLISFIRLRCLAQRGYYAEHEDLGAETAPLKCHADTAIAEARCDAWSDESGATRCGLGYTGVLCASCASGWFAQSGGICLRCPSEASSAITVGAVAGVFCAITLVCFIIVSIVQLSFRRGIFMGFVRSMRFAGWIVAALATQAQVGRIADIGQPAALREYYALLRIFELNPGGARPNACTAGRVSLVRNGAMGTSVACAALFWALGVPIVERSLVAIEFKLRVLCAKVKVRMPCTAAPPSSGAVEKSIELANAGEHRRHATMLIPTRTNPLADAVAKGRGGALASLDSVGANHRASTISSLGRGVSDDPRFIAARGSIAQYRVALHTLGGAGAETLGGKSACCAMAPRVRVVSTTRKEQAAKHAAWGLGILRKGLAGGVYILHPLVCNSAFRSVHCKVVKGKFVLASALGRECLGEEHFGAWVLGYVAIGLCVVGFPLATLAQLARVAGCFECCVRRAVGRASVVELHGSIETNPRAAVEIDDDDPLSEFLPVHGGLCCRCTSTVAWLARRREAVEAKHDAGSASTLAKYEAWGSFTHAEYAPEFFFLRFFFFASVTILSFCNTFLNPDYLVDSDQSGVNAMQIVRFVCCAAALVTPTALLVALLPYKRTARWKLPVRIAILLVSLLMLALNAFAWAVRRDKELHGAPLRALSYTVLAVSCVLLALLAVCFVFFVVFRGAQIERAGAAARAREAREDALVAVARVYVIRRKARRALHDWRVNSASAAALRESRDGTHAGAHANVDASLDEQGSAGALCGVTTFETAEGAQRRGGRGRTATVRMKEKVRQSIVGFGRKLHAQGMINLGPVRGASGDPVLPAGWEALRDSRGNAYYFCAATGESTWDMPTAPGGDGVEEEEGAREEAARWTSHYDDDGHEYYHNELTGVTAWELPAGAKARPGSPAPRASKGSSSGVAAVVGRRVQRGVGGQRAPSKFVRWKFVEREHVSLAAGLLGGLESGALGAACSAAPAYLERILEEIFVIADRSSTGTLSTLELMTMLKSRAKGTALDGDAHAIFSLKTLLSEQAEHGSIGREEFRTGIIKALRREPNGAPAQWILNELQDAAEQWVRQGDGSWVRTVPSGRVVDRSEAQPAILYELARVQSRLGTSSGAGRPMSPALVSAHV